MKQITFDNLPDIIGKLCDKIDRLEKLLITKGTLDSDQREELLTIEDAAKLLSLSVATIYTKVCKNEIPVNKQGKRLYFYKKELLDWIKLGRKKTLTEIQKEVELTFNSTPYKK